MLVLSRKINERIKIGDNIEIVVVSIAGDQVRLGIEAPKDVKILRNEVFDEVQNQNVAAAVSELPKTELSEQLKHMLERKLPEERK